MVDDNSRSEQSEAEDQDSSQPQNLLTREFAMPLRIKFQLKDLCEIIVGASVLAIPVAYTEEVWRLGEQLPAANVAAVVVTSISICSLFVYYIYYQHKLAANFLQFLLRVVACYGVTLLVVASILAMFQKLPIDTDPAIAIRRIILVGFPACFSATVVDSLK